MNLWNLRFWLTGAVALAIGCSGADGESTTEQSSDALGTTFAAVADSWVRSGSSASSNKGGTTPLYADRLDSGSAERRIFLKFNVTGVAGRTVSSAKIRMTCTSGSNAGGSLRGVSDTTWQELGITWTNQPAIGDTVATAGAAATGSVVTFDATSVIRRDGVYSFAITTSSDDEVQYASRESGTAPQLFVEFDTVATADAGTAADSGTVDSGTVAAPPSAGSSDYLLMPRAELLAKPMTGTAWTSLKAHADASWPAPSLVDQDNKHGTYVLAAALVYARSGITSYRDKARTGILGVIGTENDPTTRTLSVGRQLGSYALAANLIALSGSDATTFRNWLAPMRTKVFPAHGRWTTLVITHEDSSNNWGAWAGASLIAVSRYLGDTADVAQRARVLKGFLGDKSQWSVFRGQGDKNGALGADEASWSCDASAAGFLPTNAPCTKNGVNLDGAFPSDASRGGPLTFPVPETGVGYTNETLQALFIQAELLHRAGFAVWPHQNNALKRAADFLTRTNGWNKSSVSYGNAWLANKRLGTSYPIVKPSNSRMLVGYDWLWAP